MKTLEFKLWKYFTPIFGIFYLLWYGWIIVIKKKYKDGMNEKMGDKHPIFYPMFILYATVHIYGLAFLVAWILSLTGVI